MQRQFLASPSSPNEDGAFQMPHKCLTDDLFSSDASWHTVTSRSAQRAILNLRKGLQAMGGNSVYVDPDTISRVSSQMSRCADEIESLRSSIVPQVYEVVDRGLGVHLSLNGGSALGATHNSIVYFNHEAQIITQDLRISAQGLQKVAEEARRIEQELLQQATMFSTAGQGGSSGTSSGDSTHDLWHTLADYVGTALTTAGTIADQAHESLPDIKKLEDLLKITDPFLAGLGIGIDIWSNGKYDPRSIMTDILGGGGQYLVGLTPWGRVALIATGLVHLTGPVLVEGQDRLADIYGGQIGEDLKGPVEGFKTGAENLTVTPAFDDIGRIVVDSVLASSLGKSPAFQNMQSAAASFGVPLSNTNELPSDFRQLGTDTWNLVKNINIVGAKGEAMVLDDLVAGANKGIQNIPWASYGQPWASYGSVIKNNSNVWTDNTIKGINGVADFIASTAPNTAERIFHRIFPALDH